MNAEPVRKITVHKEHWGVRGTFLGTLCRGILAHVVVSAAWSDVTCKDCLRLM